ncbi:cytochrome-c oxidase, cbb3-type subunit III [Roseateles oligotrophus]|uniref:Cbb3-type cytochrome c oxidase subunit n=1 Tax=Roseateles oligotrophus TaxID=1769250 RepID=A0ABT2YGW8_9BURK|nr:cytochrome-c oxidase, cbb3-type subunit III [Roseateles oligotrophus]MCV2369303.1 cytochrome-c oxidase, cbb3-type subunit III [Roseateles oligotrophus]
MSDFFHDGWSLFVAAGTIAGLVFCIVLLFVASRHKVMAGDNSTGHVWDEDIVELNNPLPRWWAILFVLTVVFAGIYLAMYPGLGSKAGSLGWSSEGQYRQEQDAANKAMATLFAKFEGKTAEVLSQDSVAMGIGERLFANNCAGCHGSDGKGSKGFPNLTDTDWIYGGAHETIIQSITNGRNGVMPPMAAAVGSSDDVRNVANYVLSLSGSAHNAIAAQLGRAKFGACAACHGSDGKGNQAIGAPNLTDKVWLHGWGEDAIIGIINSGKNNVMPAQAGRLSPEQIHVLGAYVWSLSSNTAAVAK